MLLKQLWVAVLAVCFAGSAQASELMTTNHHHYLLGEWSCKGHVHTPDGERVDTVGSWTIKPSFHGHVYDRFANYTGDGFKYVGKGMTSYDKLAGVLNRHVISNMGTWTRYVSSGWDNDTLTWDGEVHRFGHHTKRIKEVLTKVDDNTFELKVRVPDHGEHKDDKGDGWKNMYKGTCTRDVDADGGHGDGKDDGKDDGKSDDAKGDDPRGTAAHDDDDASDDETAGW